MIENSYQSHIFLKKKLKSDDPKNQKLFQYPLQLKTFFFFVFYFSNFYDIRY